MVLKRNEIDEKVARVSGYRIDFVRDVIDSLVDVLIAEIVNTGSVRIRNLFSISSSEVKGYETQYGRVEPFRKLNIKVATNLKKMFVFAQRNNIEINSSNWREFLEFVETSKKEKLTNRETNSIEESNEEYELDPFVRDLLKDDDED